MFVLTIYMYCTSILWASNLKNLNHLEMSTTNTTNNMNLEAYDTHCAAGQVRAPFSGLRPPGRKLDLRVFSAARASPV